jgi:very-short-patch-repair endonuclease
MHRRPSAALVRQARINRSAPTAAEHTLWQRLRGRRFRGLKFRRQHPIGQTIVDFYCVALLLAIEVDGGYHAPAEQRLQDSIRTAELAALGIKVVRVTDEDVLPDPRLAIDKLATAIESLTSEPL